MAAAQYYPTLGAAGFIERRVVAHAVKIAYGPQTGLVSAADMGVMVRTAC